MPLLPGKNQFCKSLLIILVLGFFVKESVAQQKPLLWLVNSIEAPEIIEKRYQPLIRYLSNELSFDIKFKVSRSYQHGQELFQTGEADIGVLGPSPYLKLMQAAPNSVDLLATMENNYTPSFYGVIVTRKDAHTLSLSGLKDTHFAFGPPTSTLAFYSPAHLLLQEGIQPADLKSYTHLSRHDLVAEHVIMGRQDAGGLKASVAEKYSQYLKIIAKGAPIRDHAVVIKKSLPIELKHKVQRLLLALNDATILSSIKPSLTGFLAADESVYNELLPVMEQVDDAYKK
ncbi:MAG: PhnD/SsuA/transferrin family substrate-binding protein [Pseudomonadota bacterium]|nr:PhnD/SsuA/transferrin family substrate-binding protein [Pseudomonadota bacterium]